MDYFALALILIFCTPLGWVGILLFGAMVYFNIDAWRDK